MNFIFLAVMSVVLGCTAELEVADKKADTSTEETITDPGIVITDDEIVDTEPDASDTSSIDTAVCDTAETDPIDWETCTFNIGDHICNVTLLDVDDVAHELYAYYGRPIVIQLSAEWCSPCHTAGTYAESFMQRYAHEDLLWVTIILENTAGEPATSLDLMQWEAEMSTVDALTLAGSRDLVDLTAETGFPVSSWPTFVVVNKDMTIYHGFYGWSETYLSSVLDAMLPN